MAELTTPTAQPATADVPRDQWIRFLAEFTRENRGAHAEIEILGSDTGRYVPAENRPFDGISADIKDGEDSVWITFGTAGLDHFTHGIHNVTAIRLRPPVGSTGATLEIDAADGTRTLLELSRPEAYELPPAASA